MAGLRIYRASPGLEMQAGAAAIDSWVSRLVKLVPAEILAVYLAGRGYATGYPGKWPAVCMIMLLVFRLLSTRAPRTGPQWWAAVISAVSFLIYVYAMGDQFLLWRLDQNVASLAVLAWTTVVPVIYRGDPAT